MDESKEYIEMCEKVAKYLPEHVYKDGDLYSTVFHNGIDLVCTPNDAWADIPHYKKHPYECYPVYRQDQLQDMLEEKDICKRIQKMFLYACYGLPNPGSIFNSMEKLWLAFVMHEKYGQVWNGKDWVKEA